MTQKYFFSLKGEKLFAKKDDAVFIVFEGPDGSGESTHSKLLKEYLENNGRKVLLTKEPTLLGVAGGKIQKVLNHTLELPPLEIQELFADDRKEHLEKVILPALKNGISVISDRYFFSSFAYGSLDCDLEKLIKINEDFLFPDIVFVLKTDAKECIKRIQERDGKFRFFEKLELLKRVMKNYLKLAKMFKNVHIVKTDGPILETHEKIKNQISLRRQSYGASATKIKI